MKSPRGIKKLKTAPATANKIKLYVDREYSLYWKGRARPRRRGAIKPSRPRPKEWANLVVFLHDTAKRKRSFHIAWNGERFNDSPDVDLLLEREPDLFLKLRKRLPWLNDRLIKGYE